MTVLIVEDDTFLQDVLSTKLKSLHLTVAIAENGKQALRLMREEKPGLVLLDLVMPDMDGFELLTRIKQDKTIAHTPVVVLSNLADEVDIERARKLGAKDYLVKAHYTPSQIIERIGHFLPRAAR